MFEDGISLVGQDARTHIDAFPEALDAYYFTNAVILLMGKKSLSASASKTGVRTAKSSFSFPNMVWDSSSLLYNNGGQPVDAYATSDSQHKLQGYTHNPFSVDGKKAVSARLWDVSDAIVSDFNAGRPLLSRKMNDQSSTGLGL